MIYIPQADGSQFFASERHVPAAAPYGHCASEDELRAWIGEQWNEMFELKRGEKERLKLCELYWAGFHYEDPYTNRINPVTNYCFSTVETIWPILTESRPRPEPVPRGSMPSDRIKRIANFAQYKMDTGDFDRVFSLCVRDLLVGGWCCPMIGWDARGNSIARYLSCFDLYTDGATHESELEHFAIARPVSTARLRALFPALADKIQPDNIASPGYEVFELPYLQYYMPGTRVGLPQMPDIMPNVVMEGASAQGTTGYTMDTGVHRRYGKTSFLIQLFCRDYRTMDVRYVGNKIIDDPTGQLTIPHQQTVPEPVSKSGWVMTPMLWNGTMLRPPLPVEGDLPIVFGRNYARGGRFFAKGELDDVIPIQRAINRSDVNLDRSLELQGNPPVKASKDSGISVDRNYVRGGEIIRVRAGSVFEFMSVGGVSEAQFERRAGRRQDVQIVAGTPDALAGQRPVGIEAAAAIRSLQQGASTRARAKGPAMLQWAASLVERMMKADVRKSQDIIYFKDSAGQDLWINPDDLLPDDWSLRWASQSGTAQGEQDRQDLDLQLRQLGVIDDATLLQELDYPDRARILERVQMARQQQAVAAAAQTRNGGNRP